MINTLLFLPLCAGALSLLFALFRTIWISRQEQGDDKLKEIGKAIRDGAMAFLSHEYRILAIIVAAVAVLLFFGERSVGRLVSLSFLLGAVFSGLAGFVGMNAATRANTRTAQGAKQGLVRALRIAFTGGSVMGLSVVGFGIIGLTALTMIYMHFIGSDAATLDKVVLPIISGYSLGASSVALFARVGGGIFTKAADVGADLVGKVEAGIPEDDPRNPATIADNVGDNVGDVAGLGSDLCESYIGSIIGAMVLGGTLREANLVVLPLFIAGGGVIISLLSTFFVRTREGGDPQRALNFGTMGASVLMIALSYPIVQWFAPAEFGEGYVRFGIFISIVTGLVIGVLIGIVT